MTQPNVIKIGSYVYSENDIIGKGSFGKVFKGKSLATGAAVAVKVIYVENSKQTMLIKMIKNEVDALKRVKNENIVEFYEFTVQNNHVYIVTELCNQKDLRHYLTKYKILEERKAVEFIKQIVNAFKEMCRQQVFHRDLKPANVLLNNGVCKIADFGFAKTLDFSVTDYGTQMVSIVGTPLYMSPQLLDKQKYNTKSDIWSLGIIFYEMLFGKVPWVGKDPVTYSKNIKTQPLVIDQSTNTISPEAEDFIRQCLKVSEEDRIGWNELFHHPLIYDGTASSGSTKEDSRELDTAEFKGNEKKIKGYIKDPVNPSSLMRLYQEKILAASKSLMVSQVETSKLTIDQKLKHINQLTHSMIGKALMNIPQSRTFNMSMNDDMKNTEANLRSRDDYQGHMNKFKSNVLRDSRDISNSPDIRSNRSAGGFGKKVSEEQNEEYRKIESPLLNMKNKIIILTDLYNAVNSNDEFKELPTVKFNSLLTISRLINMIFKNLSSQVLTKKVKTRSNFLGEYLDSDSFKRLVAYVETEKKGVDEMFKLCSRKLFELKLSGDKEKDEVLEYYHEVMNEVEEQTLLGKIVDMANQMLYQIRFNSQIYKKSNTLDYRKLESSQNGPNNKEYFEGILGIFGEDSIIDFFKYDKIEDTLGRLEKLKEEARSRVN